jgi:hypothetical protein
VQVTGSRVLDGGGAASGAQDGLSTTPSGGPGSEADLPAGSGGGTTGSAVPGSPVDTGSTGGNASGTSPGGTPPSGLPVGPGVTPTSIALGIVFCNDCAAGNAAIGAGGEDPGDTRRYYRAALDDVNARGGVLRRKLVPVFYEGSVNDTNFDAAAQKACATFTQDHKVLMMSLRGEVAYRCAQKAGIIDLGPGDTGPMYQQFPNLFAPGAIRLERLFDVTVRSMVDAAWQKPQASWPTGKIGVITWDDNEYRYATKNGYLKGLHDAGLKETDVRYVTVPESARDLTEASAAISSAVLAFRREGIDHVFIGDGPAGVFVGAGLTLLFLQNAKSQSYYPRYGFNSNNVPDFPQYPQDELAGMLAIDYADSSSADDAGIALNPVRERCFALMRKRGLPVSEKQTQSVALDACGYAWFAEAVLRRATAGTTLPKMIAAAESLGTTYRSPWSYGERIGPGQHDGVALVRNSRYDETCSCITYSSQPFEP